MRKIAHSLFALAALLSATAFAAYPTGDYMTWFGSDAAKDVTDSSGSSFYGAWAGEGGQYINYSSFVGALSGYGAYNVNRSLGFGSWALRDCIDVAYTVAMGVSAGRGANAVDGCVFIGNGAGRDANGCTNCVFIGSGSGKGVYGGFGVVDLNGRIVLDGKDLSIDADNIILSVDRSAFYYSEADVYMSDGYGSDTNTGLSESSPVQTIGRAVAVVNALVESGAIPTNVPPVVLADCGRYKSAKFAVTDKLKPRLIVFKAACGKRATFLVPHYTGEFKYGEPILSPIECYGGSVEFNGFTLTRFDGYVPQIDRDFSGAIASANVKLTDCDICRNNPATQYSFMACAMENCEIYDNSTRECHGYAAVGVFGYQYDGFRRPIRNCRFYRNNFLADRLFYFVSELKNCLIVNSFFCSSTIGSTNCTFIADHFQSINITGQPARDARQLLTGRNFIVCPDFNNCTTVNPYRTNDNCVCVSSANLTRDYIAADENCPSVCDNGLPDFGYKTSMFGYYKSLRRIAAQVRNIAPDSVAIDKADGTGRVVIRNSNGSLRVSEVTVTPDETEDEGGNAPLLMSAPQKNNAAGGDDDLDIAPHRVITR